MTQVIQMLPGSSLGRRDWSPIAQPPDRHDVIAHTPDPGQYHNMGGRTMIPRHSGNFGGSQGFSVRPGVLNIDPTDPGTGAGGITIDLEKVDKEAYARAAAQSGGNPLQAWVNAAGAQRDTGVRAAPSPAGGYTVAATNYSGGVIPQAPAPSTAPVFTVPVVDTAVASPAIKPRKDMPIPRMQAAAAPWDPRGAQPHPLAETQTAPVQAPSEPQVMTATEPQIQHFHGLPYLLDTATNSWVLLQQQAPPPPPPALVAPLPPPPPSPVMKQAYTTQPAVALPPAPVAAGVNELMLQGMQAILQTLKEMQSPPDKQPGPPPEIVPEPELSWSQTKDRLAEKVLVRDAPAEDTPYTRIGMDFLGDPPKAPTVKVIFKTASGLYRTKYHAVARRGICLSLVYDSRYDGDQYIPSNTAEGEVIHVSIPSYKIEVDVDVFDYHNQIGCLDVLNLVIVEKDRLDGPPVMEEQVEHELLDLESKGGLR